ncbi:nicotinate-nucleotide adenylyltransferase [Chloroflexota bacterium]
MMNIGVLGGTFDPIHKGHLLIAEEVRAGLNLAEVLFVPAGQPQLRKQAPLASAEHRLQMVRLAIADKPGLQISTIEMERAGPSYTVDTIAELKSQLGAGNVLFFILGWNSLSELPQWREPSRLIRMCRLVAVPRPGYPRPDLEALENDIPGLSQSVALMDKPLIEVSGTVIRERVARGLSIDNLVPEPVERYIREHGLYSAV